MLTETEIQEIKNYRLNGNSYEKIAKKMDKSKSTIIKYCKEEESQEESKNEVLEVKNPEKEKPLAYYQEFEFIEAIKDCEAIVEHITHKEFGHYNHKAKIFQSQFEYTLGMLKKGDNESLDALNQLYIRYQNFDDKCDVITDLKGDITRLRRERTKKREEDKTQERLRQDKLRVYYTEIDKKRTEYQAELKKVEELRGEVSVLEKKKSAAQQAVNHLIEEGREIVISNEKQIENSRERYQIILTYKQMQDAIPYLQGIISQEIEKLENINNYRQLMTKLSFLKKPLENLVEVVSVLPSDLFKKMCISVENRKVNESGLILSNQSFTPDGFYQMMMGEIVKAMNREDELNEIIKLRKFKEMTKS